MGRPKKYKDDAARQRACRKRKRVRAYLRHQSAEWSTPADFFAKVDAEFHFTLDVAAIAENAKCARYFTPEQDGLKQKWTGVVWCNPPYGPPVNQWMRKACESAQRGATVVVLVPARTDTKWWHDWVLPHAEVRFIPGRLKFNGVRNSAPFPSVLAIFRPLTSR